jgi:drug/metabolite transporter (DMT)-like permease
MATLLASIFTILNGRATKDMPPLAISTIEMMAGAICLFLFLAVTNGLEFLTNMSFSDTGYIVILSICCTCVPFLLSIYSLQKLEPFVVTLTVNLEPIYGLIFAGIFWQEYQNFNIYFYLGSFLILFSVFLPMINDRWKRV